MTPLVCALAPMFITLARAYLARWQINFNAPSTSDRERLRMLLALPLGLMRSVLMPMVIGAFRSGHAR